MRFLSIKGANKDEGTFWILFSVNGLSKDSESLLSHQQFLDGVDVVDWDLNNVTKQKIINKYKPKQVKLVTFLRTFIIRRLLTSTNPNRYTCNISKSI